MKKVAIYARVSSERQEEQKTIQSQLAALREACKDFQIVKEYIDDGWSGETLDRPALDRLRNDAKDGLFEALCIHSVDRLSRKLHYQGILVEELKKRGVEIFVGNKPIEDTPEAELLFNMLGAVAQYEKEKILERTKRGKMYKARKGIVVGNIPPFGYDYIKKTSDREGYYRINPKEAEIVKLIFDLYLKSGNNYGVFKELTTRGIKPPGGTLWRRSTIRRFLANESYTGITHYNKTRAIEGDNNDKKYRKVVNSRKRIRDRGEWIPIPIPPIIEKKVFIAVQELMKKYSRANNQKHFYLLSGGIVKCARCGSTFCGAMGRGNSIYKCCRRYKRFISSEYCEAPRISGRRLEDAVWNSISEAITKPQIIVNHISNLNNRNKKSKQNLNDDKKRYLREKEKIEYKRNRLLDVFTDGVILKSDYLDKLEELNQQENGLKLKIGEIENRLSETINRPLLVKDIKYFCSLAKNKLNTFTSEERQQFLRYLIDQVVLDSERGRIKIEGCIPVGNNEILQSFSLKSEAETSIS